MPAQGWFHLIPRCYILDAYGLYGRKKRSAEPTAEPAADPAAEADPWYLYSGYYGYSRPYYHGYYGYRPYYSGHYGYYGR